MKYEIFKLVGRSKRSIIYKVPEDTPMKNDIVKIELFKGVNPNSSSMYSDGSANTFKITYGNGRILMVPLVDYDVYWREIHEFEVDLKEKYTTVNADDVISLKVVEGNLPVKHKKNKEDN